MSPDPIPDPIRNPSAPSANLRRLLVGAAVLALAGGCLGGDPGDGDDETGDTDDTRVELIYVDGQGDTTDVPPSGPESVDAAPAAPAASDSLPPAPSPADEAGGDELIVYDSEGDFTVQVGTYTEAATARRRVRELERLGYPAYAVTHPGGGQVRVRIGYFGTREQADNFGQRFRRDHGDAYWVDQRRTEMASR